MQKKLRKCMKIKHIFFMQTHVLLTIRIHFVIFAH